MDYTFMKTGVGGDGDDRPDDAMAKKLVSLVVVMMRQAMDDALTYAEHAGRRSVTVQDVERSLKHQARTFFKTHDLETSMEDAMAELFDDDDEWTTDEESEGDRGRLGQATEGDRGRLGQATEATEGEPFTESACECSVCVEMNACWRTWDAWTPDDPVEQFLKMHVDKAITRSSSSTDQNPAYAS